MSAIDEADVAGLVERLGRSVAPELQAAWLGSYEMKRVRRIASRQPEEYGGLTRICAAIATCVEDFERRMRAEELNARRGGEASGSKPAVLTPEAPAGYGYRACSTCRGSLKEGRGEPCRCTKYGGRPGLELFAVGSP